MIVGDRGVAQLAVVALDLVEARDRMVQALSDFVELKVELVARLRRVRQLDRVIRKIVLALIGIGRLGHARILCARINSGKGTVCRIIFLDTANFSARGEMEFSVEKRRRRPGIGEGGGKGEGRREGDP